MEERVEAKKIHKAISELKAELSELPEWRKEYAEAYVMGILALEQLGALIVGLEDRAKYNIGNEAEGLKLAVASIRETEKSIVQEAEEYVERI